MGSNRSLKHHLKPESAFTLFEMLAVAVILLIFTGLIATFVFSSVEKANRISCMNNMKQILMAIQLYGSEHWFRLPQQANYSGTYESDWSGHLTNYLHGDASIFRCPSDQNARRSEFDGRPWRSYCVNGTNQWSGTYGAPYKFPWPGAEEQSRPFHEIPTRVILIGENHGIDGGTGPGDSGGIVGISEMESLAGHASAMHRDIGASSISSTDDENGGGNYGYIDGRVEFHMRSQYKNPNPDFDGGTRDPWKWL